MNALRYYKWIKYEGLRDYLQCCESQMLAILVKLGLVTCSNFPTTATKNTTIVFRYYQRYQSKKTCDTKTHSCWMRVAIKHHVIDHHFFLSLKVSEGRFTQFVCSWPLHAFFVVCAAYAIQKLYTAAMISTDTVTGVLMCFGQNCAKFFTYYFILIEKIA